MSIVWVEFNIWGAIQSKVLEMTHHILSDDIHSLQRGLDGKELVGSLSTYEALHGYQNGCFQTKTLDGTWHAAVEIER